MDSTSDTKLYPFQRKGDEIATLTGNGGDGVVFGTTVLEVLGDGVVLYPFKI
ncbi:hypothetical protein CHISP_1929 [Chitinispirillum alkaliphilum]|nr:hypothetical protein CHISP_1929 [Chitinispirillum alkaliphilum]